MTEAPGLAVCTGRYCGGHLKQDKPPAPPPNPALSSAFMFLPGIAYSHYGKPWF